ncbi:MULTISPECIES: AI-2E family transporter [Roseobacteraceae]|jgi:predicted PurR-regulated permease PerM|uniref:AI-2 transport protein TqsA n=1 Tax=Pseudosulfitobacter pseudonitzschiae TaxID=1402135 RepID=A0A221JYY6_9RHOB|nr:MULTISPECIES: AI-2E family transporter [Roseobacteraceae]ASM71949.1 AI-2 transport protein TqsA [Pseudosulfitobacter pseudonitzschiae]
MSQNSTALPVVGIFIIMLIYGLVAAASFLIPVTAAVLAYFVLSRPRRGLERLGIPSALIAFCFTGLIISLISLSLYYFSSPVSMMVRDVPELLEQMQNRIGAAQNGTIKAVAEAAEAVDNMIENSDGLAQKPVEVAVVDEDNSKRQILTLAPQLVSQLLFAVLLLFFLLSSGDFFLQRAVESIGQTKDKTRALEFVTTIERRLGRYLGGITLINAGLGLTIGSCLYALGVNQYIAIGVMAFALNFIPYFGGLAGACIAALLASSQYGAIWSPVLVFLVYMTCTSIEGQVVTPLLISRRMHLNAPVLFLVVAFFAYIWSVIGMIVAVPLLIVAKIILDEIEPMRHLGRFLGDAQDIGANSQTKLEMDILKQGTKSK